MLSDSDALMTSKPDAEDPSSLGTAQYATPVANAIPYPSVSAAGKALGGFNATAKMQTAPTLARICADVAIFSNARTPVVSSPISGWLPLPDLQMRFGQTLTLRSP